MKYIHVLAEMRELLHFFLSFHSSLICLFEQVHLDYLEAGADIIITASYQVNYCSLTTLTRCECVKLKLKPTCMRTGNNPGFSG